LILARSVLVRNVNTSLVCLDSSYLGRPC
jgi:hypothetical protein